MTSGNIQMDLGPDRVLETLRELLREDPGARQRSAEEDSAQADAASRKGEPA